MKNRMLAALFACSLVAAAAFASSHREAPAIAGTPRIDCSDFYAFNSYETGREGYVTLIANYIPLQDAYGGPNYFTLDEHAVYEIHIDNDGDAIEDLTFQFKPSIERKNIALSIGGEEPVETAVPVINVGPIGPAPGGNGALNVIESYALTVIRGDRAGGETEPAVHAESGETLFSKPVDYIGRKSIPDYEAYANAHIHPIRFDGCDDGRVFVGQRKDPFVVNLGETFDLVNIQNPLGPVDAAGDDLAEKNVTSFILEVPADCLTDGDSSIIGAWTTASVMDHEGMLVQESRLGAPLVNEVVIGLKDKNAFNRSEPKDDAQFAQYVTHPTLPAILEILFGDAGVRAPTAFPRTDLVSAFLTGVEGLNQNGSVAETMRLNTSIDPVPANEQNNLGVLGGDTAGFPNGRRPGDDVVDIALRVVMGALLPEDQAPSGRLPFTDGALVDASMFDSAFPYLKPPIPGSPQWIPVPKDFGVIVTDTLQTRLDLSGGEDIDETSAQLAVRWNYTSMMIDEDDLRDTHVYVSANGGPYAYLGRTADGGARELLWQQGGTRALRIAPAFRNGPQSGQRYQFRVYALTKSRDPFFFGPFDTKAPVLFAAR